MDVPTGNMRKATAPTVLWLGRMDPIKNPELALEFARSRPDVEFYFLGLSTRNPARDRQLQTPYRDCVNIHFLGHDSGKLKMAMLEKAWILLNTSHYECLPVSFLEAMAHHCALLSTRNPDEYTSNFGVHAEQATVTGLSRGLNQLLYADNWKHQAQKGYCHALEFHEANVGLARHIQLYRMLTE